MRPWRLMLMVGGGLALATLVMGGFAYVVGFRGQPDPSTRLPEDVQTGPAPVREAYNYAVEHPEVLRYIPCYCGCVNFGHTNNEDCFVDARLADGTVVFDRHGFACGTCVAIARDAKRLTEQGWALIDVRKYIETTYSEYGPGTDTPQVPVE